MSYMFCTDDSRLQATLWTLWSVHFCHRILCFSSVLCFCDGPTSMLHNALSLSVSLYSCTVIEVCILAARRACASLCELPRKPFSASLKLFIGIFTEACSSCISPPRVGWLLTMVAISQLSICQLELKLNLPHPSGIILTSLLKWSGQKQTKELLVGWCCRDTVAISYVLLTGNGNAGDWKEYKYCIDWLGEGELGEKKEESGNSAACLAI